MAGVPHEKIMMNSILMICFIILLVLISWRDFKTQEIPNGYVLAVAFLGVAAMLFTNNVTLAERLLGGICISVPLILINLLRPNAFGGGDIKLMAAAGFYLGWQLTLFSFFIAVLTAGVYAIWLLLTKKKAANAHFAFGPFLCFGMLLAVVAGFPLMEWYFGLYLI